MNVAALNGPAPFPSLLPACTSVVGNTDINGENQEFNNMENLGFNLLI